MRRPVSDGVARDLRRGGLRSLPFAGVAGACLAGDPPSAVTAVTFGFVWVPLTLLEGVIGRRRSALGPVPAVVLVWIVILVTGLGCSTQFAYLDALGAGLDPGQAVSMVQLGGWSGWLLGGVGYAAMAISSFVGSGCGSGVRADPSSRASLAALLSTGQALLFAPFLSLLVLLLLPEEGLHEVVVGLVLLVVSLHVFVGVGVAVVPALVVISFGVSWLDRLEARWWPPDTPTRLGDVEARPELSQVERG